MGVVWLAKDEQLRQDVALKVVPEQLAHDRFGISALRRETAIALKLTHPGILRTYDFHCDGETAAVVMEFFEGKNLREIRADEPFQCFTPDQLIPWLQQVVRALHYAHTQVGVIHRDIKPANIMLLELPSPSHWTRYYSDWRVLLADFGIARVIADGMTQISGQSSTTSGTLPYMSPQQMKGETPEPKDDVYSLGATIYELLAGEPPIIGPPELVVARAMNFDEQIELVSARRARVHPDADLPPIPPAWDAALGHALRKDKDLRTRSIDAFASELGIERPSVTTQQLSDTIWMTLKRFVLPKLVDSPPLGDLLPLTQRVAASFPSPLKEEWLSLLGVLPDDSATIEPIGHSQGAHREKHQLIAAMAAIQDAFTRGLDHPVLFALRAECYQTLNLHRLAISDQLKCLSSPVPKVKRPSNRSE